MKTEMLRLRPMFYKFFLFIILLTQMGCRGDDALKSQVNELTAKVSQGEKKIQEVEESLKKAEMELLMHKSLLQQMGNSLAELKSKPKASSAKKTTAKTKKKKR